MNFNFSIIWLRDRRNRIPDGARICLPMGDLFETRSRMAMMPGTKEVMHQHIEQHDHETDAATEQIGGGEDVGTTNESPDKAKSRGK